MQLAGGIRAAEAPATRDEARAIDPTGLAAGAGIAEAALGRISYIARFFAGGNFLKKRFRGIESAPLIGHAGGWHA